MLCTSFSSFSLSLADALHLLQRFLNSSNQIKQIHSVLLTSNALVPSRWKTKCVYNTLIRSYLTTGHYYKTSLSLFNNMLASQVQPINLTFPSLIKAACFSFSVSCGLSLHGQALKRGVLWDPYVQTSFVRFYGEVGDFISSRKMFDEIIDPCVVACNSMLDACGRNGEMASAFQLFQRMPATDVVSWTSVINGCGKNGLHAKALMVFYEMIKTDCEVITPNEATLVSVLSSCASLDRGGFRLGKQIHGYLMGRKITLTTTLGTALLDMYGKAGHLEMAVAIFCRIGDKEVSAWNAIISAFASNGKPEKALEMFERMKSKNVHPNGITLLAVLTACARSKLVDLGIQLFSSMCCEYKIVPTSEHYGCIVDLIGRAGLLVDAVNIIRNMSFKPDASVLGALLGACKIHEDVELGNRVGKTLIQLQPQHSGQYVALSTLNALGSNWTEAEQMRQNMIQAGSRKIPAFSVLSYGL